MPKHVRSPNAAPSSDSSAIPAILRGAVDRPRLDRILDGAQLVPVTLICAPAGSGKSVLAGSWARRWKRVHPVGWLQCSALSDGPTAFWSSVVTALVQAVGSDVIPPPLARLSTARSDRSQVLDELLSWLAKLPAGTTVVCDDFSEIGAATTQRDLQYVIDRLPTQVHLMIVTRSYPPLAVHRARLEGQLLDIRASDLAFDPVETSSLLAANHLRVEPADQELLLRRTEGWAAGLRLAAMAMAHAPDPSEVIHRLADSTEVVSGYLTEQVLAHLSTAGRSFLLDICVADEVSPDLASVLTERSSSQLDLEQTADRIGFLSRTAGSAGTFRFHPMFAELLRTELAHSDPDHFRRQHGRAARWYEIRGLPLVAVRHAQAAEDWDRAARLVALNGVSLMLRGRMPELTTLAAGFPQDVAAEDARLMLVQAIVVMFANDPDRAELLLDRAQANLPHGTDLESRRLTAITAYVTTLIAHYHGDLARVLSVLDERGPNVPGPDDSGFDRSDLDLRAVWRSTRAVALDVVRSCRAGPGPGETGLP